MPGTTYTAADRRRALDLADRIGLNPAARQLGIHPSTLRTWAMRRRRDDLPVDVPVVVRLSTAQCAAAPTPRELRRRWEERGSYRPARLMTGAELLDLIWTDRRTVA